MDKVRKLFHKLETDSKSVLFIQEQLNDKLLKRLKKSKYIKDKEFVNSYIYYLLGNKADFNKKK